MNVIQEYIIVGSYLSINNHKDGLNVSIRQNFTKRLHHYRYCGHHLLAAGFWLAYQFVEPAPPTTLSIGTGSKEGAYYAYALQYKERLAKQGITLNIETSAGSAENIDRLLANEVDLAFAQGGLTQADTPLLSLAVYITNPLGFSTVNASP